MCRYYSIVNLLRCSILVEIFARAAFSVQIRTFFAQLLHTRHLFDPQLNHIHSTAAYPRSAHTPLKAPLRRNSYHNRSRCRQLYIT